MELISCFKRAANPHARSAFRRLVTLYWGLSRALDIIRSSRNLKADKDYEVSLARLEEIIVGQISTADNALEDWKDIVPEEVKQLTQAFESDNQYNGEKQWLNQSAGKVACVLNAREIAINVGSKHGVSVNMFFDVVGSEHSNIKDPDTKEVVRFHYASEGQR